jgi:hypothetical protein
MTIATITKTAADLSDRSADAAISATPRARGPQRPARPLDVRPGPGVTPELRITADHPVHPYLVQLHRGGTLLAYAIRDAYGWAVTAKSARRTRTVARAGQLWAVEAALLIYARGGAR